MNWKLVTLTVDITVRVHKDVEPDDITFNGIENAVPMAGGLQVGSVKTYCTQEYMGEDPV